MKYLMLTYLDEKAWMALTDAQRQAAMADCEPHTRQLLQSGKLLSGAPLHPTSTATCVRVRSGKRLVTDGPYAETREQLGGYSLIEARDLDEAIEVAAAYFSAHSICDTLTVEVRPVVETAPRAQAK